MIEAGLIAILIATVLYMANDASNTSLAHAKAMAEMKDKLYKCESRLLMYEREED